MAEARRVAPEGALCSLHDEAWRMPAVSGARFLSVAPGVRTSTATRLASMCLGGQRRGS